MSFDKSKEDEKKAILPKIAPKSPTLTSPRQEPPSRIRSSNTLFGEDIVTSGRSENQAEQETIESYSDDEQTANPPSKLSGEIAPPSPPRILRPVTETVLSSSSSLPSQPSSKPKGRPPRAPSATSTQTLQPIRKDSVPIYHKRVRSTGEFSFMSALTDEPSDAEEQRDRAVTWDENFFDVTAGPSLQILQPVLDDEPPRSIRTSPPLPKRIASARSGMKMNDILCPMESEAESAILKALEDRERKAMRSIETVLPNLTDEALDNFLEPSIDANQSFPETPSSSNTEKDHPVGSPGSNRSSIKGSAKESASIRTNSCSAADRKPPGHQRTNTSTSTNDMTLFSLATMMRNIQHKSNDDHGREKHEDPRKRAASHDDFIEETIGASDALANQAALLFRGKLTREKTGLDPMNMNDELDPKKNDDINEGEEGSGSDIELGLDVEGVPIEGKAKKKRRQTLAGRVYKRAINHAKDDWDLFHAFFGERQKTIFTYMKILFLYLVLPALGISCLFFYALGNPNLRAFGNENDGYPSISWFILFLCVRQVITFSFAKMTEMLLIDFLALKTRVSLKIFGPLVSLMVVQSKGWPFLMAWWAFYDLCMLSGDGPFANHWLFYQNVVSIFSEENPSGNITSSSWNYRILFAGLVLGVVVAIKRFAVGLYLGGRQYLTYGSKLATVIHKMIIISQIAGLARRIEYDHQEGLGAPMKKNRNSRETLYKWSFRGFGSTGVIETEDDEDGLDTNVAKSASLQSASEEGAYDPDNKDQFTKSLHTSERIKLTQMLEAWEEPIEERENGRVSIQGILQFKQTLAFMDLTYPFSTAFGLANKREACVDSAQDIYRCLLLSKPESTELQFETLTVLAMTNDNTLDEARVKELVRVFRPDRDGKLSMLDFVRSVDRVYKDLRLLRASIQNSAQIDQAFEALINVGFYFLIFCLVLASWNIDPLALFLSLSSVIVAFAFAIGSATSKYFEGLLFILGRNPYDVGDRISINQTDEQPMADGVFTWYVENVSLYYTTLRLGATNEVATVANSAMANSRIVNAARSPKALIYINLKFGIDVPYNKILLFKEVVETFVKARPREWLSCSGIRCVKVEADLGYVQYVIILQHRDSWQHLGGILEHKAAVMSYCLEIQKKLGMRFLAPPTPVDLTVKNPGLANILGVVPDSSGSLNGAPSPDRSNLDARVRTQSADLRRIAEMFAPTQSPVS